MEEKEEKMAIILPLDLFSKVYVERMKGKSVLREKFRLFYRLALKNRYGACYSCFAVFSNRNP